MSDELHSWAGARLGIVVFYCGFPQPSLIWLLLGAEVLCGICGIPGTISRHSISSPNVVSEGGDASSSLCGITTAGTLNLDVPYLLSPSRKESAASSQPGCVNWSSFICVWSKPLHALLYHVGVRAYHPAGFIIFAQLALLCLFIILIFRILPIVRTCKITQTVSDCNHHLLNCLFGLSVRQSGVFSCLYMFLGLLNHCLCVFNLHSCTSGFSQHDPQSISPSRHCLRCAFLVVSRPEASFWNAKCAMPQGIRLCLRPSRSCLHSLVDVVGWTVLSICHICPPQVLKVLCRSFAHCSLHWLCCWVRCWMLEDMDNMEASCFFYVKVGTFTYLEQSKISLLTVNTLGIVRLTVQHDLIVSLSIM